VVQFLQRGKIDMGKKPLKTSCIILTVIACVILFAGFMFIFFPEQMYLTNTFNTYVGADWHGFKTANGNEASYFVLLHRELGIFILVLGAYGLLIVLKPYRNAEKWAWWVFLAGNTAGWVTAVVVSVVIHQVPQAFIYVLLLVISYAGLGVGAKYFFTKTS
jgi:hypothetical protein